MVPRRPEIQELHPEGTQRRQGLSQSVGGPELHAVPPTVEESGRRQSGMDFTMTATRGLRRARHGVEL